MVLRNDNLNMIEENNMKIDELNNKALRLENVYEKHEDFIVDAARGSLVTYSVGIIGLPLSLVTGHPHIAMICAATSLASISAFSASLGVVVGFEKKINKLNEKVKILKENNKKLVNK